MAQFPKYSLLFRHGSPVFFMIKRVATFCRSCPRLALAGAAAAVVMACAAVLFVAHDAHALKITMKRVIFEGPRRAEVLTLINNTADETAFRLGWRTMRMTPDKGLVEVPEGAESDIPSAEGMVIFAPRRVVIPPGGSQQIRLMLRKPRDLAEGEYRSHLWIRPEADAVKFDPQPAEAGKSSVQIKMLAGVSLPVFVRHGQMTATAAIENATLRRAGDKLAVELTLTRQGNRSIYGDFDFICAGAEERVVRQVRGIAIYTDVPSRKLNFSFPAPETGGCSSMRIVYTADRDDPLFKGNVIAQATVGQ